MTRLEHLRCEDHANGYGGAHGTYCADCITVQRDALRQFRDFQDLRPMPEALAEKLGVVPFKDEWLAESEDAIRQAGVQA